MQQQQHQRAPLECMHERVGEQDCGSCIPSDLEKIVHMTQLVLLKGIKDRVGEQIGRRASAPDQGGHRASDSARASGPRAESRRGADRVRANALDQGGHRASDSARVSGPRAESRRGSGIGWRANAPDQGGYRASDSAPCPRTACRIVSVSRSGGVPQIKEDGLQLVPQERTQNRSRKLVVDVPVPHIKEKIMDGARVLPQERVQDRVTYTGNVFTMRHHRDDQACAVDTVGLNIKGVDKYIMPQSGDSLVPVSQIQEQIVQEIVCEVPKVKVVERIQGRIHVEQASVFWARRNKVCNVWRSRP